MDKARSDLSLHYPDGGVRVYPSTACPESRPLRQKGAPKSAMSEGDPVTLIELVEAVCDVTDNEDEINATILHLLQSGRIRLGDPLHDGVTRAWSA